MRVVFTEQSILKLKVLDTLEKLQTNSSNTMILFWISRSEYKYTHEIIKWCNITVFLCLLFYLVKVVGAIKALEALEDGSNLPNPCFCATEAETSYHMKIHTY